MKFIDTYYTVVPSSFKRPGESNFSQKESQSLKEFGELIDSSLESNISKQEAGTPFSGAILLAASSTIKRSASGGNLIGIIETALDEENTIWVQSWLSTKTVANLLLPPPAGAGFPAYLEFPLPVPATAAPAGANIPVPTGAIFLSSFNSKTTKLQDAKYIGQTIQKMLQELYLKWQKTGPKPYTPIPS